MSTHSYENFSVTNEAASEIGTDVDRELNFAELPREVGVMLVSVGVLGVILPGVAGIPALMAGGLVLWPKGFQRVDSWFKSRYPQLHKTSTKQIGRYLDDLERRFPDSTKGCS